MKGRCGMRLASIVCVRIACKVNVRSTQTRSSCKFFDCKIKEKVCFSLRFCLHRRSGKLEHILTSFRFVIRVKGQDVFIYQWSQVCWHFCDSSFVCSPVSREARWMEWKRFLGLVFCQSTKYISQVW